MDIVSTPSSEMKSSANTRLRATIMIVDDEPITMEMVQVFLEDVGYRNFVQIEDSTQAMATIEEKEPDIILLDLVMPEVSGFEILQSVRNHPKFKYLPVIILTASADPQDKLRALDLGATDFLAKPVDPSELGLRVRNTLAAKAYLDQLANYDRLTSLPNRNMFFEKFMQVLNEARRHQDYLALLNIELDNFDTINDTIGIKAGDEVLRQISLRIGEAIRRTDLLGLATENEDAVMDLFRMESSVFSLFLYRIDGVESAAVVAQRIIRVIREPLQVEGRDVYVTASIGIATFPTEADDRDTLVRLASSAKDFIKNRGGDSFQFSSPEINEMYSKRQKMESRMRTALTQKEFILFYQPKVDLQTGKILGVEGLIRWRDGSGKLISPGEFIPLAEENGFIVPLGEFVLREGCRQLQEWHRDGRKITMSLNLSAKQLKDPGLLEKIREIIAASGVDASYLTIEITESLLMEDVDKTIGFLGDLKKMGLKISIDDFGTGYSSLSYLRQLPIDELKIDQSFVFAIGNDRASKAIVSSIVFLATSLGLYTVAEGIETEEQLQFLKEQRCNQYQGFLFSRPIPPDEFYALLLKE